MKRRNLGSGWAVMGPDEEELDDNLYTVGYRLSHPDQGDSDELYFWFDWNRESMVANDVNIGYIGGLGGIIPKGELEGRPIPGPSIMRSMYRIIKQDFSINQLRAKRVGGSRAVRRGAFRHIVNLRNNQFLTNGGDSFVEMLLKRSLFITYGVQDRISFPTIEVGEMGLYEEQLFDDTSEPTTPRGDTLSQLIDKLVRLRISRSSQLIRMLSPHLIEDADILTFDPNRFSKRNQSRSSGVSGTEAAVGTVWGILFLLYATRFWRKKLGPAIWKASTKMAKTMYRSIQSKSENTEIASFQDVLNEATILGNIEKLKIALVTLRSHLTWMDKVPKVGVVVKTIVNLLSMFPGKTMRSIAPKSKRMDDAARIADVLKTAGIILVLVKAFSHDERWTIRTIELMTNFLGLKRLPPEASMAQSISHFIRAMKSITMATTRVIQAGKIVKGSL